MKNNSQHPKPEDGEKRKLKKPVICYPNEAIKIDRWSDYQAARKDLDKIDEIIEDKEEYLEIIAMEIHVIQIKIPR